MSCFILNDKSTAAIAAMLDRVTGAAKWANTVRYGVYHGRDLYALFKREYEQMTGNRCSTLDSQKIYAVLRRLNEQAYGERYLKKSINEPEEMPIGEWVNTVEHAPWQMLKTLECYLYQCDEGEAGKSELLGELQRVERYFAKYLINKIPEYDNANWG